MDPRNAGQRTTGRATTEGARFRRVRVHDVGAKRGDLSLEESTREPVPPVQRGPHRTHQAGDVHDVDAGVP